MAGRHVYQDQRHTMCCLLALPQRVPDVQDLLADPRRWMRALHPLHSRVPEDHRRVLRGAGHDLRELQPVPGWAVCVHPLQGLSRLYLLQLHDVLRGQPVSHHGLLWHAQQLLHCLQHGALRVRNVPVGGLHRHIRQGLRLLHRVLPVGLLPRRGLHVRQRHPVPAVLRVWATAVPERGLHPHGRHSVQGLHRVLLQSVPGQRLQLDQRHGVPELQRLLGGTEPDRAL